MYPSFRFPYTTDSVRKLTSTIQFCDAILALQFDQQSTKILNVDLWWFVENLFEYLYVVRHTCIWGIELWVHVFVTSA